MLRFVVCVGYRKHPSARMSFHRKEINGMRLAHCSKDELSKARPNFCERQGKNNQAGHNSEKHAKHNASCCAV
eukprot:964175-Amphidinium_carterae.1